MELEQYKSIALQRLNKTIANNEKESMYYACMGIMEETGEIVAEIRKPLFKGNFHEKKLDIEKISKEIGDLTWYVSLICKNTDIDMNQIEKIRQDSNSIGTKRERLIQIAIKIGENSGKIIHEYQEVYRDKKDNVELLEKIQIQFSCICELLNELDINIDQILNINIQKVNSRYNKKGEAIKENDDREGIVEDENEK